MTLEVKQLRYFVAVAEELHFAKASDRLGVAASAVSAQIQRLEQDLGVTLLDRGKRKPVSLTSAGQVLYVEALSAIKHFDRAEQVGQLASKGMAGVVRLGYVASAVTTGLLSTALKSFRAMHSNVRMDLVALDTPRQLDAVANGDIDLGLARPRRIYPEGVGATIVHSERLLAAFPVDHPLAGRTAITAADLRGQRFVTPQFNETEGFAGTLERLGAAGGFPVSSDYWVNDFITAVSLSAAGYGVVIVPESIRLFTQPGVVFLPISDFREHVHLALASRKRERSPAVRAFIDSAIAAAGLDRIDDLRSGKALRVPAELRARV